MKTNLIVTVLFAIAVTDSGISQNLTSYDINGASPNIAGTDNTALGKNVMSSSASGCLNNTGVGKDCLFSLTTGDNNVGIGKEALYSCTGGYNVAAGVQALYSNTSGDRNIAVGLEALYTNNTGSCNTAVGHLALYSCDDEFNTGVGYLALYSVGTTTGNTSLGAMTDVSSPGFANATAIGANAIVNSSDKIRFGDANVNVVEGPVNYTTSDRRFKFNINENEVPGLAFINQLRPVNYNLDTRKMTEHWTQKMPDSLRAKHLALDFTKSSAVRHTGFIAQEVEDAMKSTNFQFDGLYVPTNETDNYSLSYSQFVVPLVKAVQEQQKMIEALQTQISKITSQQDSKATGVTNSTDINSPRQISMQQNEPNPFTHETSIPLFVNKEVKSASIVIFDLSGKQIKSIEISKREGSKLVLSAEDLSAGIYLYSLVTDGVIQDTKRMVVAEK